MAYLLLFGVSVDAQPTVTDKGGGNLGSILRALRTSPVAARTSIAERLTREIMALASADRKPSSAVVSDFAGDFTEALIGKALTNSQVSALESSITNLSRGLTATFSSAEHLRQQLEAIQIDGSRITIIIKRFVAIGEQIRGPDDQPILRSPLK